ncbi:hypothetical protein BS47DRAFT_1486616 [Hydnum rufescens UP504]|uniref:Uncharacterized protein n=1 Tax=Hydnum rufescens UP504 TaxID=1448309 RepID=A0A9P6AUC3_9AGAM|nr:hypothetical protein BS47DRAFT_1486616 [Hydnum rufescens UP504]
MPEDLLELVWRAEVGRDEGTLVGCGMVDDSLLGWCREGEGRAPGLARPPLPDRVDSRGSGWRGECWFNHFVG